MTDFNNENDGENPKNEARAFAKQYSKFLNIFGQLDDENEKLKEELAVKNAKIEEQQETIDRLMDEQEQSKKDDEWGQRLTFEAVVEEIASNEDAAQRDQYRRFIETMLPQKLVKVLRRAVKKRVKELNEEAEEQQEPGTIPAKLKTEEVSELMQDLVEAGILDENWQPIGLSGSERALVVKAINDRVELKEVWQLFGQLWNEKPDTLRSYLYKALDMKKSVGFQDRLKNALD